MVAKTIANFDIFLISESKIDSTFKGKLNLFLILIDSRVGLMLYLNETTSCKFLNNHPIVPNAEIICIEFHQFKRKWLLLGCYKSPTQNDLEFIASITKIVDFYL